MPVSVKKLRGKYRIVEPNGDIATTPRGHPRDAGGHKTREEALKQMRAINASLEDPDWREKSPRKTTRKGGDKPGVGKLPYGDVKYADPGYQKDGQKRYPIDDEEHIRAAWNYINHPKNAGKYSSKHLSAIRHRIIAAWKKHIDKKGPPEAAEGKSDSIPHPTSF
jgi:hypothetical protein